PTEQQQAQGKASHNHAIAVELGVEDEHPGLLGKTSAPGDADDQWEKHYTRHRPRHKIAGHNPASPRGTMRASRFLIATQKETPADAEVVSHQLMLRAGMIRKLAAGLYTWLPLGLRVLRKVENIVREEMDKSGAQEVLMPVVQPADLWVESGRWEQYGPEL